MSNGSQQQLLQTVGDYENELAVRLRSLQQLGLTHDPSLVGSLKRLFERPRPGPERRTLNWDRQAAERVVDLHIVETLHELGDDSELYRITALVRQAGNILQGPDDELRNAASVILAVGRKELIGGLIALTSDSDPHVVRNAVRTLDQLRLSDPPVGQGVASVPQMSEEVTFTIRTLKEEMEALVSLSRSSIVLSPGVKAFLVRNDYDRGTVSREGVLLSDIIEKDLPELEFAHFVEGNQVVICTYREAGARWQSWWGKNK